jgi:transcriptional regulator with PAS, ATPase and Fis domain
MEKKNNFDRTKRTDATIFRRELVGASESFIRVKTAAANIAKRLSTVLILGQTGTGKQMLAEYIHTLSDRSDKPFVPVDCLALTDGLFESELFGHTRGAFTGAVGDSLGFARAADGGTLFLDEIGELSFRLQGKLLRLLQEQLVVAVGDVRPNRVDVRVIAATNKNLYQLVQEGAFREDLYFRLNVVTLKLPTLCQRRDDILPLADYFLTLQAELYHERKKVLSPQAAEALLNYDWPGNVRQLSNVMEHAHILTEGNTIDRETLPHNLQKQTPETAADIVPLDEVQRRAIIGALKRTGYNKTVAARRLGVNIQRFNRFIKRLNVPIPHHR